NNPLTRIFPSGSENVIGLLFAYAYPFICCGSLESRSGSADRKRPVPGSYSRAPRLVRVVTESCVPPTKALVPGQEGCGERCAPKGRNRRWVTFWVAVLTEIVWVP